MQWKNSEHSYGGGARILHWTIGAMFIALVVTGVWADNLPRGEFRGALFDLHRSLGVSILPLVAMRILWRVFNRPPGHGDMKRYMAAGAMVVHGLLYVVMVTQPLTGLFMYLLDGRGVEVFGAVTVPPLGVENKDVAQGLRTVHEYSAFLIYGLLAAHIGAALFHQVILKDDTLRRMAGRFK